MASDGVNLLESLAQKVKDGDSEVLAAIAGARLRSGMAAEGLTLLRQAAAKQPHDALYLFYIGLALARSDNPAAAEQPLKQAIELDPSRKEPYIALCTIYEKQGRLAEKAQAIDRYLKWNPQSISFRLQLPKAAP